VAKNETKESSPPSTATNPSNFVKEAKEELDKVVWPDRQQLISESLAVIFMVSLSAVIISLVDNLFQWMSQWVF
jgi:preprotein translocase subunit SecE